MAYTIETAHKITYTTTDKEKLARVANLLGICIENADSNKIIFTVDSDRDKYRIIENIDYIEEKS